LTIGQVGQEVPFDIKRFYYINNLFNEKAIRGRHAHKKTEQYIFCLNGRFTLEMDDGKNKQTLTMNSPYWGVRLGKMLWHNMKKFSHDCVILVIANDYYKKNDYIRNYDEFLKLVKTKNK
jgi:dTDP-4-dehydrorhamnose 3,5-epimerase-like enzyme